MDCFIPQQKDKQGDEQHEKNYFDHSFAMHGSDVYSLQ
jgi:hypothetical protein